MFREAGQGCFRASDVARQPAVSMVQEVGVGGRPQASWGERSDLGDPDVRLLLLLLLVLLGGWRR